MNEMTIETVQTLVLEVIDDLNTQLPDGGRIAKTPGEVLVGREGKLDSLNFVNLVVSLEQKVDEKLNVAISLVDDDTFSPGRSPFRTIQSLTEYVYGKTVRES